MRAMLPFLLVAGCGPAQVEVSLAPDPATVEDTLVASVTSDGEDVDDAAVELVWTVEGEQVGTGSSLSLAPYAKGQLVRVEASAGRGESSVAELEIANAPPQVTGASIEPSRPASSETLSVEVFSRDADDDAVTYEYVWFVDGEAAGVAPELSGVFSRGNSVYVEITPIDGEDEGEVEQTEAVEIGNGAPDAPEPTLIAASEWIPSGLRCSVAELPDDPDEDDVDVEMRWVVDGVARPAEVRTSRTLQVGPDETVSGGEWACEARSVDPSGASSDWVAAEDSFDQDCDRDSVVLTGARSASLAYSNGTSWNDTTLRAYTFGVSGGNDDIVGWIAFDLRSLGSIRGVADATLDLHVSGAHERPEVVVVQAAGAGWSAEAPTRESLVRDGEISEIKSDFTPGERTRFALDMEAWTRGPGPGVEELTIGVDNLKSSYSYAYFASVKSTTRQPELELTVCR